VVTGATAGGLNAAGVAAEMRSWRAAVDDVAAYDELVLWYEHDLFDQLNLIQLLDRLRDTVAEARPVTLICVGAFPGRADFRGLGELTPQELASLRDVGQPVTAAQYALAREAWSAFRSSDPRRLAALVEDDTSALAFLKPALRRLLEELPFLATGLSRTERRVLELAHSAAGEGSSGRGGGNALRAVFHRLSDGETAFYLGDLSFRRVVEDLAATSPPLLELDAGPPASGQLLRGTVTTTAAGRAALDGELDRVVVCGIDRWLGGVHLQGRGPVWRWDDERRSVSMQ
jgi:hypothetical protein